MSNSKWKYVNAGNSDNENGENMTIHHGRIIMVFVRMYYMDLEWASDSMRVKYHPEVCTQGWTSKCPYWITVINCAEVNAYRV